MFTPRVRNNFNVFFHNHNHQYIDPYRIKMPQAQTQSSNLMCLGTTPPSGPTPAAHHRSGTKLRLLLPWKQAHADSPGSGRHLSLSLRSTAARGFLDVPTSPTGAARGQRGPGREYMNKIPNKRREP